MSHHVELVDINSVIQDPANARLHSPEQLKYIAASLKRFAQQKPIVVGKDNVIIAGNGTHLAARDILNWKQILIIRSDLSMEEARAYGIADNQIPTQAEWDVESLSKHLKEMAEWNPMQDWNAIGFENDVMTPFTDEDSEDEPDTALADFLDGKDFKPKEEKAIMAKPIKVTEEQWEIIDQAITIIKMQTGDIKMSAGRALELMCADWLSGMPSNYTEKEDE